MEIVLLRHGEINSNVNKIYAGRSVDKLNSVGIDQAKKAASFLAEFKITHLFSSPLDRAVQTAEFISQECGLNLQLIEELNELKMGPWEGLSEREIEEKYPEEWRLWSVRPDLLHLPGRETLQELHDRVLSGLNNIFAATEKNAKLCIVTHVAIIRIILMYLEGRQLKDYKKFEILNAHPIIKKL